MGWDMRYMGYEGWDMRRDMIWDIGYDIWDMRWDMR